MPALRLAFELASEGTVAAGARLDEAVATYERGVRDLGGDFVSMTLSSVKSPL